MTHRCVLSVVILVLGSALIAGADTITSSGTTNFYLNNSGTFSFWSTPGDGSAISGTYNASQTGTFSIGGINLPYGATLTGATLSLFGGGFSSIGSSYGRTETDYSYVAGYYQSCGFFGCSWYPYYNNGYGGSGGVTSAYDNSYTGASLNGTDISVPVYGGAVDLLAQGLGAEILAGHDITVDISSSLTSSGWVSNYGYYAQTNYLYSAGNQADFNALLTVNYTPLQTPEPVSLLLFGSGLVGIGVRLRKRIAR